jgi:hypothetical protein
MIVIDANIITELWGLKPNPKVLTWIDVPAVDTLY